jgi:hypothetical protein
VLVRGKVTEAPSGKPVPGAGVQYVAGPGETPRGDELVTGWEGTVLSGAGGNFRIPVPPGPGHLLVSGPTPDYLHEEVGSNVLYLDKPGGMRFYPDALVKLNPDARAEAQEVAVTLRRGVTVKGRLVDPDGKPVTGKTLMLCRLQVTGGVPFSPLPVEVRGGRFELPGCDPGRFYPVYFLEPVQKLGAAVTLSGKQAGGEPVKVRLLPCGQAAARFVNQRGKPLTGFRPLLEVVLTPGPHRYDPGAFFSGKLIAGAEYVASLDRVNHWNAPFTDARGRCTFPALIPGATYRVVDFDGNGSVVKKEFTVESGQTRELGDVTLKRRE